MNVAEAVDLYFEDHDEGEFASVVKFVTYQIDDAAAGKVYDTGVAAAVRKALTAKGGEGLPKALSLLRPDGHGEQRRVYRPLRLFDIADYRATCAAYGERASEQLRMRDRLRRHCVTRYGVDPEATDD